MNAYKMIWKPNGLDNNDKAIFKSFFLASNGTSVYAKEQELKADLEKNIAKYLLELKATEDDTIEHRICVMNVFNTYNYYSICFSPLIAKHQSLRG
jgi:hypothetical protein